MLLSMAIEAARTKSKFHEARHKIARQVGHRHVRYQKSKGRRGDAMEEEVREVLWERHKKSICFTGEWREAQSRANAEEKTSRFDPDDSDDVPLILLMSKSSEGDTTRSESIQERDIGAVEGVKAEIPGTSGHRLITSFFRVRR